MTDYKTSSSQQATREAETAAENQVSAFHIEEDDSFSYADYKIEDWLAFILFWLLAITVFSQFLSRYVFSSPLGWTEELARYQLVCLGFIGSCIGIRNNSHIFVMLFHRWLPRQLSHNIYRVIAFVNLLFLATLAYFAWQIIPLISIHRMASLPVPVSVLYGIVLGCLCLMIFRSSQYLFNILSSPASEKADDNITTCD